MNYTINNKPLESYGFRAGWINSGGEAYALMGQWSLPKRSGKCYHEWGYGGIEPYVDADDIVFEARNFTFSVVCLAPDLAAFNVQLKAFLAEISDRFTLNQYEVILSSAAVKHFHNGWGEAALKLKELNPMAMRDIATLAARSTIENGIDGYSWAELGLVVETLGDRYDVPSWQPLKLTLANHTYGHRSIKTITLQGTIKGVSFADFESKIKQLQSVISAPGIRKIRYFDNTAYNAFCVDGFTVTDVKRFGNDTHWCTFNCKMIEI